MFWLASTTIEPVCIDPGAENGQQAIERKD